MFGWVEAGKRRFFVLLVAMITVEVVVVVLLVRSEHDRFPPLPDNRLRSTSVPRRLTDATQTSHEHRRGRVVKQNVVDRVSMESIPR